VIDGVWITKSLYDNHTPPRRLGTPLIEGNFIWQIIRSKTFLKTFDFSIDKFGGGGAIMDV